MISVLGAGGLIGGRLCKTLRDRSIEHYAPARHEALTNRKLGHVVYCIGVTADFRSRVLETVEAHVCKLLTVVRDCDFESLLYISSTRVYGTRAGLASESDVLSANPANLEDVYNISKIMGESVALNAGRRMCVARISNVYGDDFSSENFLSSVIRDALVHHHVTVRTAPNSEKDYIHLDDVLEAIITLTKGGREDIYNVARGENISNGELMDQLSRLTGCTVNFANDAPTIKSPKIDVNRMRQEFDFRAAPLNERIEDVISRYQYAIKRNTRNG